MTSINSTDEGTIYLAEWAREMLDLFRVYGRPIESVEDPRAHQLVGTRCSLDSLDAVQSFLDEGNGDLLGEDYFNFVFNEKPPVPLAAPSWVAEWGKVTVSKLTEPELTLEMWADKRIEVGLMVGEISQAAYVRLSDGRVRFTEPTIYLGRGKTEIDLQAEDVEPFLGMLSRLIAVKDGAE